MQPPNAQARCASCGAPDDGELVICRYCKQPINAQLLQSAIACPQCRTANRWGKQKCAQCTAWIVVACVFCGSISPVNQQACLQCHEPFAGSMQKKQMMMQQQQHQQNMQTYGAVGNIAASFAGAAAGSALTNAWFGASIPHHHHSWGGDGWTDNNQSSWDNNTNASYDNSQNQSNWGNAGESAAGDAGNAGDGGLLGGLFGGGDGGSSDGGSSDGGGDGGFFGGGDGGGSSDGGSDGSF